MNLLPYAKEFVNRQMAKDPHLFFRSICASKSAQSMMSWAFQMLVSQKISPDLQDLEPEIKREVWEMAKDMVHNSGYECTKELGITMCKSLIVIQMLK